MSEATQPVQIPWQHRREIGRLRSFFQTAWLVTFKTRTFCRAVSEPVDFTSAVLFRRMILLALFVVCVALSWYFMTPSTYGPSQLSGASYWIDALPSWINFVLVLSMLLGLWLLLEGVTGLHTYWFHPRQLSMEQQNRSLALSHYACAPLLFALVSLMLLPLGILLIVIGMRMDAIAPRIGGLVVMAASALLASALVLIYWRACFILARDVAQRKAVGRWSLFLFQPILMALLGILTLVIWPAMVFYTMLILSAWS